MELADSREWHCWGKREAPPEENEKPCRAFTLDHVVEWVEKYENMDERFHFFETYVRFSQLYQQIGKSLLLIKCVGSIDVEHTA